MWAVRDKSRRRAANVDEAAELGRCRGEAFHYHEGNNILLSKSFSLLSPRVAPARCLCPVLHQKRRQVVIIDGSTGHQISAGDEWLLPQEQYLRNRGRTHADGHTRTHAQTHAPISTLGQYNGDANQAGASDFCQTEKGKQPRESPVQFTPAHFFILHNEAAAPTHTAVAGQKGGKKWRGERALINRRLEPGRHQAMNTSGVLRGPSEAYSLLQSERQEEEEEGEEGGGGGGEEMGGRGVFSESFHLGN